MKSTEYSLNSILEWKDTVRAGDALLLSGTIYTARDAAHKKLVASIEANEPLPFDLENATIYYCGPTPAPEKAVIGSCGPTTSSRMDPYTARLMQNGVVCTIGKGERSKSVYQAILEKRGLYLVAIGGCGALYADAVKSIEEVAYPELGCESIKRLEVENFPVYVAIDTEGNSIFDR